jgi:hypothetical protein
LIFYVDRISRLLSCVSGEKVTSKSNNVIAGRNQQNQGMDLELHITYLDKGKVVGLDRGLAISSPTDFVARVSPPVTTSWGKTSQLLHQSAGC